MISSTIRATLLTAEHPNTSSAISRDFEESSDIWEHYAQTSPLERILGLGSPDSKWTEAAFFQTGVVEVKQLLSYLDGLGLLHARQRALDFGCGVGRLSQALSPEFEEVQGIDASPTMIRLAERYNRFRGRCKYTVLATPSLDGVGYSTFDLVYSNIALQHVGPNLVPVFLSEMRRVLKPSGVLVFQLPSPTVWQRLIPRVVFESGKKVLVGRSRLDVAGFSPTHVRDILTMSGARLVDLTWFEGPVAWGAAPSNRSPIPVIGEFPVSLRLWISYRYCAVQADASSELSRGTEPG